ncbi:MAG: hypothetical protein KDJ29_07130 [Hyphomicrobiales bacterium]|nr:hypothetical protein [Hyphomicrobiales bacterium]
MSASAAFRESGESYGQRRTGRRPSLRYESILRVVFAVFVFCGCIAVIEPSPYDLASLLFLPLLAFSGFKIYGEHITILSLWIVYILAGFLALMPHWGEIDPTMFQFQSLYLVITFVMFLFFFSQKTLERSELALKAFAASCIVSAIIGLMGFADVAGLRATRTAYEGRVNGLFKDPNAFGSYMILGAVYLLHLLALGRAKRFWLTAIGYALVMMGIFLSFSRGSIGATIIGSLLAVTMGYLTCGSPKIRQRIVITLVSGAVIAVLAIVVALSIDSVRELIQLRFNPVQDYDAGPTGRFGNQIRSLPMLLELPNGFGPLRFRLVFKLEPHNSYINGFASYGWIGGFAWIMIVLTTCYVGFRLMLTPSPYRFQAQVWFSALFVLLLQGFQIDIDHWRWVFLGFAAVWGLETTRVRWLRSQKLAAT